MQTQIKTRIKIETPIETDFLEYGKRKGKWSGKKFRLRKGNEFFFKNWEGEFSFHWPSFLQGKNIKGEIIVTLLSGYSRKPS